MGRAGIRRGYNAAVKSRDDAFYKLDSHALTGGDAGFVHQHVVNAYAAQRADTNTKAITLAFALIGLYLHVELGFTGRQVQRVHMDLARFRRDWPIFPLPTNRGAMTVEDVLAAAEGPARYRAIDEWCASVWGAYGESHGRVAALLREYGIQMG
jgi:hypothetical protein